SVSGGAFRIRQVVREVVGILVRVPGPAAPRLGLGPVSLRTVTGTGLSAVVIGIGNDGRRLCKPALAVSPAGGGAQRHTSRQPATVLPGDAISCPLILDRGLRPATYSIDARVSCAGSSAVRHAEIGLHTRLRGVRDLTRATPQSSERGGLA